MRSIQTRACHLGLKASYSTHSGEAKLSLAPIRKRLRARLIAHPAAINLSQLALQKKLERFVFFGCLPASSHRLQWFLLQRGRHLWGQHGRQHGGGHHYVLEREASRPMRLSGAEEVETGAHLSRRGGKHPQVAEWRRAHEAPNVGVAHRAIGPFCPGNKHITVQKIEIFINITLFVDIK